MTLAANQVEWAQSHVGVTTTLTGAVESYEEQDDGTVKFLVSFTANPPISPEEEAAQEAQAAADAKAASEAQAAADAQANADAEAQAQASDDALTDKIRAIVQEVVAGTSTDPAPADAAQAPA